MTNLYYKEIDEFIRTNDFEKAARTHLLYVKNFEVDDATVLDEKYLEHSAYVYLFNSMYMEIINIAFKENDPYAYFCVANYLLANYPHKQSDVVMAMQMFNKAKECGLPEDMLWYFKQLKQYIKWFVSFDGGVLNKIERYAFDDDYDSDCVAVLPLVYIYLKQKESPLYNKEKAERAYNRVQELEVSFDSPVCDIFNFLHGVFISHNVDWNKLIKNNI